MMPAQAGDIKVTKATFIGDLNAVPTHLIPKATEIKALWDETHDRQLCEEHGAPFGIRSPYHAGAILANLKRVKEVDCRLELNAVSLGEELAFVTYPGELFDTLGARIEENAPFKTTLVIGYSQDRKGYLPSSVAYKYTSYETDTTRFAPGTGEKLADTYVELLKTLKEK